MEESEQAEDNIFTEPELNEIEKATIQYAHGRAFRTPKFNKHLRTIADKYGASGISQSRKFLVQKGWANWARGPQGSGQFSSDMVGIANEKVPDGSGRLFGDLARDFGDPDSIEFLPKKVRKTYEED